MSSVAQLFSIQPLKEEEEEPRAKGELMLVVNSPAQQTWEVNQLDLLDLLLVEYEDLFKEPKTLPPPQSHDHSISLKPNSRPFNARAYQYPPAQKIEIERMVKEMRQHSLIQPNHNPFAFPVLLVKKDRRFMALLCGLPTIKCHDCQR